MASWDNTEHGTASERIRQARQRRFLVTAPQANELVQALRAFDLNTAEIVQSDGPYSALEVHVYSPRGHETVKIA